MSEDLAMIPALNQQLLLQWPVNWSLASYEDVGEFFQKSLFKDTAAPGTQLTDVMSSALTVAYPDMSLEAAKKLFNEVMLHHKASISCIHCTYYVGLHSGFFVMYFEHTEGALGVRCFQRCPGLCRCAKKQYICV